MSASETDTQAATRLLERVLDSFEKLEIAVYVHRAGFATLTRAQISNALALPADEVEICMKALERDLLFDPNGPWRTALDALVRWYDEDRIEVLNLMTRTALGRVRKEAARVFADAFVLRPKKKGDPDA